MKKLGIVLYSFLCAWYILGYFGTPLTIKVDVTQFSIGTILLFFLLLGLVGYWRKWTYADLSALAVVVIWGINQYYEHWQPLIYGASPGRVRHYNEYFKGTIRIFVERQDRIVPDVYHIVIGLLIVSCSIVLFINLIRVIIKQTKK